MLHQSTAKTYFLPNYLKLQHVTCNSKEVIKEHEILIRVEENEINPHREDNKKNRNIIPCVSEPHTPQYLHKTNINNILLTIRQFSNLCQYESSVYTGTKHPNVSTKTVVSSAIITLKGKVSGVKHKCTFSKRLKCHSINLIVINNNMKCIHILRSILT